MVDSSKVTAFITALTNKFENKQTNKKDSIDGDFSSDSVSYPTVKAVKNFFGTKITSWSNTASDSNYPSEKLVKDELDEKISKSNTAGLVKNDGTIDTSTYLTSAGLSNYVEKSQTAGLIKNDGTIDTTTYLSQHQDISGKENISNKVTSISSSSTDTQYPSAKLLYNSLDEKISKSQTVGLVKNDGTIDTTVYLDVDSPDNISNLTDGIYLLAGSNNNTPQLKLYTDEVDSINLYPFDYYVADQELGAFTVDWGDGTIGTISDYEGGQHNYSETGEYIITVDWSNGPTTINNNGGYDTAFGFQNINKIELPYGITSLVSGDLYFNCYKLDIPSTVTSISLDLFSDAYGTFILHWDTADTILQNVFAENIFFSIPYGTTSLYTAKGYPSAKLTERAEETVSASASTELYIKKDGEVIEVMSKDDVEDLLDTKLDATDTFSGSYDDLTDKPDIPTKTSDLINDADGTSGATYVLSTDSRLTDSRTPTSHTHGSITNDGKIGSDSGKIITTGTGGALQASNSITKSMISDFPTEMTPASHTHGSITNDGKIGSASGKIITTGDNGVLQASNSITKSMISDFPSTMTPAAHEQATSTITNATAFDNILSGESTTLTLTDQAKINAAINTKIGALQGLKFIEITTNKGTASASTMGKLYIENSNNKTDAYYTKESSGNYSWVKLEDNILEDVSISWSNVTNKPESFTPSSHTHGNITNAGAIGSTSGKIITTGTNGVLQASDSITKSMISDFSHTHNYTTTSDVDAEIEAYLDAITTALSS